MRKRAVTPFRPVKGYRLKLDYFNKAPCSSCRRSHSERRPCLRRFDVLTTQSRPAGSRPSFLSRARPQTRVNLRRATPRRHGDENVRRSSGARGILSGTSGLPARTPVAHALFGPSPEYTARTRSAVASGTICHPAGRRSVRPTTGPVDAAVNWSTMTGRRAKNARPARFAQLSRRPAWGSAPRR